MEYIGPDGDLCNQNAYDITLGPFNALRQTSKKQYCLKSNFGFPINHYVGWKFKSNWCDHSIYKNKSSCVKHFKNADTASVVGDIRSTMIKKTLIHCHDNDIMRDSPIFLKMCSNAPANDNIGWFIERMSFGPVHDIFQKNLWRDVVLDEDVLKKVAPKDFLELKNRFEYAKWNNWDKQYSAHAIPVSNRKANKNTLKIKDDVKKELFKKLRNNKIIIFDDTLSEGGTAANAIMLLEKYGIKKENVFLITIMKDY